jgi:ribosomal protein S18 acetylase RimI-like enzyme
MPVSIANAADITELVQLVNSAYRGEGSKKGWTTEADLLVGGIRVNEDRMAAMLHNPANTILKYTNDQNQIIGCVLLAEKTGYVYLGMLTVSPELQGAGIGKELLKAADEFAKGIGKHNIRMTVITARTELINWYKRHGYQDTGERLPFPYEPGFGEPSQQLEFAVLERKWPQ